MLALSMNHLKLRPLRTPGPPLLNPKDAPYIYHQRNGIYIIDLQKDREKLEEAYRIRTPTQTRNGESLLFVGTKKQQNQEAIKEEPAAANMYFVQRPLAGA